MRLEDIVRRSPLDAVDDGPRKLPWDDPAFSARMLREHLSQDHGGASRRLEDIENHVRWIHGEVLAGQPARILDLGCGPGLYTSRLSALGHSCTGIDSSPASIAHAGEQAASSGDSTQYVLADVRSADLGGHFDLAMMLFGEINAFSTDEASALLARVRGALVPGGTLLLEVSRLDALRAAATRSPSWRTAEHGLFADEPHIVLDEAEWDDATARAASRWYVIRSTGVIEEFGEMLQGYDERGYEQLLAGAGFAIERWAPSLAGGEQPDAEFAVIVARAA